MNRPATLCFDELLPSGERDARARALRSSGAQATSWNDAANRTYANVLLAPASTLAGALFDGARLYEPPLFVARVTPSDRSRVRSLAAMLGGPGRPAGVIAAYVEPGSIVIELDTSVTSLSLFVMSVDVEIGAGATRRIEPLLPVDDATLAAFGSALLREPALDTFRLIETYLEPMLSVCP